MKKLFALLLITSIFAFSCSPIYKKPSNFRSGITDYSRFNEKGFFITESNSVSFDYQAIGSVYVQQEEGYEIISNDPISIKYKDDVTGYESVKQTSNLKTGNKYIGLDVNKGLDELHRITTSNKGNGIINLKITFWSGGYNITGMAIKK
ncbi:hypothetical protein [Pedobacter panaciterrae]